MVKNIAVTALCILFSALAIAQKGREDVLYLNNGSILRGKILENKVGDHTTLEIAGHNILVIPEREIQRIAPGQKVTAADDAKPAPPVGMIASVSFLGGSGNSAGFQTISTYRFPSGLSAGAGFGIEWFDHQQLPLFADLRYFALPGAWSPYGYLQGGWAPQLSKHKEGDIAEYYGGPLGAAGVGFRYRFGERTALMVGMAYRYQKTKTVTSYYYWGQNENKTIRFDEYNRISVSIGFLFN